MRAIRPAPTYQQNTMHCRTPTLNWCAPVLASCGPQENCNHGSIKVSRRALTDKVFTLFGAPRRRSGQISLRPVYSAIRLEASKNPRKERPKAALGADPRVTYWIRETLIPKRECYYK